MDIEQVEAFLAVAQFGGFTAAAAKLHRSQPAVSRRLSLLEEEIGAPLFDRTAAGVALTDVGRAFHPHATAAMASLHDAKEAARSESRAATSPVIIAIVGTLLNRAMARTLARFRATLPCPQLRILTGSSDDVSNWVRQGAARLGVRYSAPREANLTTRRIGTEAFVVVASPQLGLPPSAGVEELSAQPWVTFPVNKHSTEAFGRVFLRQAAAVGLSDLDVVTVDSLSAQKRLVEEGFGLGFLRRSAVADEIRNGALVILEPAGFATTLPISIIHRREGYLGPGAEALMKVLPEWWTPMAGDEAIGA